MNNKTKRQHQHNFLFLHGPQKNHRMQSMLRFHFDFMTADNQFFFVAMHATDEIIDCPQIFHVISEIKSPNYRARSPASQQNRRIKNSNRNQF